MAKRMALTAAVLLILVGGLGLVKFRQVKAAVAANSSFQPPPEAVTTVVARQENWPAVIEAIGTVTAVQGVTVSADLPGIVQTINFDSGKPVKAGDILVQLDTRQEHAQLADAEAQRDLAKLNFARAQRLASEGVIARMDFEKAEADQRQAEARVAEMHATIERKTIRAPFSGILGIRQVNLGQYLAAGNPIVPLQALNPIYVNVSVPQQATGQVHVGQQIEATTNEVKGLGFPGRVTAIDSVVDEATRNFQVQATLQNPDAKLRPGMFLQVKLALGGDSNVVSLPSSAISYAPYGDSVFVLADMNDPSGHSYRGVRQQFVKLGPSRGDQVAVLSGIKPGDEVVSSGAFKLRNGAAVKVNNAIQPSNNVAPHVEDR
jgi:membrane fusion protein (multidrug efflux system)